MDVDHPLVIGLIIAFVTAVFAAGTAAAGWAFQQLLRFTHAVTRLAEQVDDHDRRFDGMESWLQNIEARFAHPSTYRVTSNSPPPPSPRPTLFSSPPPPPPPNGT